tara:strand:- start:2041 stop:3663 length:1623 start_codon:yes stop_codon:yes gene_type:complete
MKPFLTLHQPSLTRRYYASGLWQDQSFYDLLVRNADATPDRQALKDGRQSLSWLDLRDWTDTVAAEFSKLGLVAGDRVSIWMSSRLETIVVFLACSRMGLVCNPSLHKTYTASEIAAIMERLETRVLISEPDWGADPTGFDRDTLFAEVTSLKAVLCPDDLARSTDGQLPPIESDPDAVGYLAFTSGTTGAPKCVMHSANTLLANARDMVDDWKLSFETRLLTLSPLSHHIAWVAVGQWLLSSCVLITNDLPLGIDRLDWFLENDPTYVMGVPTHAMDILEEFKARKLSTLGRVETFYMAGSQIPQIVAESFVELGIKPQNVYGMTENSSHQYTHPADNKEIWIQTCGRGGRAYEVKIFDTEDLNQPASVGQVGQIGGRGAALMLGYFANQEATSASFNDQGWFLSGDLGSLDAKGNLRIEGRLKDLIIRGGHNIYPTQIEDYALRHEDIKKAAAFGVPDDRLGERVCLAIQGTPEPEQVFHFLADQGLSVYDMPEFFLRLEEFPLTASGKIRKQTLVHMVKRGTLAPEPVRYSPAKEVN